MKTKLYLFFLGFSLAAITTATVESSLSSTPPPVAESPEITVDVCDLEDVVCEHENVTIAARVSWYSVADSCHFPAKDGGCYSANYPHKIQKGDVACPKVYEFGTKVEYAGKVYTCNDRTADWVQNKWAEPTFDIFVPTSSEVKSAILTKVIIHQR